MSSGVYTLSIEYFRLGGHSYSKALIVGMDCTINQACWKAPEGISEQLNIGDHYLPVSITMVTG